MPLVDSNSPLRAFRARHISTARTDAEKVQLRDDPREAAQRLQSLRFDQAPVENRGHIEGWVLTARLSEAPSVKAVFRPLRDSAIVSADASIGDVLQLLAEERLVFTVADAGLAGFVTPSDLDRHAARSHFYLLVSDIEMALAEIVRHSVDTAEVVNRISDDIRPRWTAAVAAGEEADAVEYLYLQDLAELFLATSAAAGLDDSLADTLTALCQFRPAVMHPTRQLLGRRSAAELASLARRGEAVAAVLGQVLTEVTGEGRWK